MTSRQTVCQWYEYEVWARESNVLLQRGWFRGRFKGLGQATIPALPFPLPQGCKATVQPVRLVSEVKKRIALRASYREAYIDRLVAAPETEVISVDYEPISRWHGNTQISSHPVTQPTTNPRPTPE